MDTAAILARIGLDAPQAAHNRARHELECAKKKQQREHEFEREREHDPWAL